MEYVKLILSSDFGRAAEPGVIRALLDTAADAPSPVPSYLIEENSKEDE
jgi:hypothetical protein